MASKLSDSNPGLQKGWLNLILHLTAIIAERRQDIGSAHLLSTIYDVFVIIFLEGVLAIVSIPIYFRTDSGHFSRENEFYIQYRLRKYITFLLIWLISLVFILKLCLVLWITFSADVVNILPVNNTEVQSAGVEIINTEKSNGIPAPVINDGAQQGILVSGKAEPNGKVIVFVTPPGEIKSRELSIFRTVADSNGLWSISNGGTLRAGSYVVTAVSVDPAGQLRSDESKPFDITVSAATTAWINETLGRLLAYLVLPFIGIGLIVLILTI